MNIVYFCLQLFVVTLFYFCYALANIVSIDFLENMFTHTQFRERSSILLLLQIVLRLTIAGFMAHFIPIMFEHINNHTLSRIFDREIIYKTIIVYLTTTTTFDNNLIAKCSELRKRIDEYLTSHTSSAKKSV